MPIGPTNTKAQKQKVVRTEMKKFQQGDLHSGSKSGPVVKNPKQAIAISLSESGQSKKKTPVVPPAIGKPPKMGAGESKPDYDRSSHFKGNPGFPGGSELVGAACTGPAKQPGGKSVGAPDSADGAEHHKGHGMGGAPHCFPASSGSHGYGNTATVRSGGLRLSGHPGAHRIGRK